MSVVWEISFACDGPHGRGDPDPACLVTTEPGLHSTVESAWLVAKEAGWHKFRLPNVDNGFNRVRHACPPCWDARAAQARTAEPKP